MTRLLTGTLLAALGAAALLGNDSARAAAPGELWRELPEAAIARNGHARQIVPDRSRAFELNRGQLAALLHQAPPEHGWRAADSFVTLALPLPDGSYGNFRIVESPVMEPGLAARYPQIKTYLGQGVDDPGASVRFDLTPKGFHAQIIGAEGTLYIDPFQPGDLDHYIAYRKRDHTHGERGICEVTGEPIGSAEDKAKHLGAKLASGATLRTYRLALAATGEYTQFHGGTLLDGLSALVTTMNRVDGIYEREVAVRMVLVANNDLIVYTDPATDPYTNDNPSSLLTQNTNNLNSVIGSANYDIGHVAGTGGGGLAGLGVVCSNSKAQGETGSSAPVADGYDVDYVAHEMGHQFGGNHTFNGSGSNCSGGNRNGSTAYEPGSGITIQAYAGICGGDDLQPNSDDYFHRVSLNEIINYTTVSTGSTCGTTSATGNAIPTVSTPPAFTIPGRTPFTLTASGSDADGGDVLTYLWEQFDLGAANAEGVLDPTALTGPLFRAYDPSTDPTRTFPSWRYILNNANAVPATAPLEGTASPSWMAGEVLPNASRTLNFRVTVRDNKAGGGGTNEAATVLTVANTAGPFAVTAPNTAVSWAAGSAQTVTWNVASTAIPPVSAANVRITLSVDGGHTWPIELLASTPNDGSQGVTIPAGLATTQARVRVEAVGNIFFDVSDVDFTITNGANTAPTINVTGAVTTRQGSPTASAVVATVSDAQDAAGTLAVSVGSALPELTVSVSNSGGSVTLFATAACTLVAPTSDVKAYPVLLRVTDSSGAVSTAAVNVNVGGNATPTLGAYPNLSMTQSSVRQVAPNSLAADASGNLSATTVSPTTLPGGGTLAIAGNGTVTATTTGATPFGTYPVQAQVADSCGAIERRSFNIVVGAPQVTLAIASSQVAGGNGLIEPNECNSYNVTLRNDGNTPATGVSAVLSTATPNASIAQAASAYPDIPPGESRTNSTPFQVSTAAALTCFSTINLTFTASYAQPGSPFAGPIAATVGQPLGTNYAFTASSGATLPSDGTLVAGSDASDATVEPIVTLTTPFAFSVYGTSYAAGTALRASTNGNLQFRATKGAPDFGNAALPVAGSGTGQNVFPPTAPTLFLQWDDWRMDVAGGGAGAGAGIYTKVEGSAPNRNWFIEWRGRIRGDGAATTNNNRAGIVLHENSNSFDYVYLLTGVGASANGAGSTIGIQSAATGTTFTQYALDNANLAPGTKLTAAIPPAICSAGAGVCAGPPGVTITESGGSTNVTEGGATDSYTVVLNAQPSSDVTVTITPDAQVTTSVPSLVFTTANWNVARTVTVTAVNDGLVEGAHTGTITHGASGGGYDAVVIPNVVANVTDNDSVSVTIAQSGGTTNVAEGGATDSYTVVLNSQPSADVTVSITPDAQVTTSVPSLLFTTANWNTPQPVTVTAVNDAVAEGAHTGTITHGASGGGYDAVVIANVTANITDNDTAGVTIVQSGGTTNVTEGGATDGYTVVLTSQPTADVTVTITPDAQVTTSVPSLLFTTANWSTPQPVTVTAVDDAVAEGAHSGTITHSASGGGYNAVVIANVVANITDNDAIGVTLVQSGGTTDVTEGGATDSYTLKLNSQPTGTVTITVTPDAQVTTDVPSLTFDTVDWNTPKTVTVTAVDDAVAEGPHTGTITHGASGGGYGAVVIANVVANVTDDDTPGVTLVQSGGTTDVTEGGATDSYTIRLNSQPTGLVTITITPDAQVTTSVPSLTFNAGNWDTPQPVTVTAVDDALFEGPHTGTITHGASGGGYGAVVIPNVVANVTDNDPNPVNEIFEDGFEDPGA